MRFDTFLIAQSFGAIVQDSYTPRFGGEPLIVYFPLCYVDHDITGIATDDEGSRGA